MHIVGITVCVNYADLLERSIERWVAGLNKLIVVTTPTDKATIALCEKHNVETFKTTAFYLDGAKFNKGRAIMDAYRYLNLPRTRWLLLFDADIVPPIDWKEQLIALRPTPGNLYGARRYQIPEKAPLTCTSKLMPQSWVIGFFMLASVGDSKLWHDGIMLDETYTNAGCYDTDFSKRWERQIPFDKKWDPDKPVVGKQVILPISFIHLGEERQNWVGRGNAAGMQELLNDRIKHGGKWSHEHIKPYKRY